MAAEARFPIVIEGNAKEASQEAADAMENLRQTIQASESKIRDYSATLRRMKGSSDEVKAAKDELRAKILAEQSAVSKANLELHRAGTSYDQLARAAKATASAEAQAAKATGDEAKKLHEVESAAKKAATAEASVSKTHEEGAGKLKRLGVALETTGLLSKRGIRDMRELKEATGGAGGGFGLLAVGVAAAVAALIAVTGALVAGAAALSRWIVLTADAARTQQIHTEAVLGSAAAAKNLVDQVDDISSRVPLARSEISDLGLELAKGGLQGQKLVDAMNAVAQTTAAKGKEAGDAVKKQLLASLGAGAAAARQKAEKELGSLNARGMLSLTTQTQRFHESLDKLTSGVNLEPLLRAIAQITSFFDQDTVTGGALKELVTAIGDQLGTWSEAAAPFIKQAMKQLLILVLEASISFLQLYHRVRDAFGPDTTSSVDLLNTSLVVAKVTLEGMALALVGAYALWRTFAVSLHLVAEAIQFIIAGFTGAKKAISEGWDGLGGKIVQGLIGGITGGATQLVGAVTGLADKVKAGFKSALGIHSPSAVFAEYGQQTAAGFEHGVGSGTPRAQAATSSMGAPPGAPAQLTAGGPARGASVEVHVHINAGGGAGGDVAKQVTAPGVLEQITKAVEDALATAGLVPEGA